MLAAREGKATVNAPAQRASSTTVHGLDRRLIDKDWARQSWEYIVTSRKIVRTGPHRLLNRWVVSNDAMQSLKRSRSGLGRSARGQPDFDAQLLVWLIELMIAARLELAVGRQPIHEAGAASASGWLLYG